MHSSRVPKPSSTATATSICLTASGVSHSESAAGQRQQGSFVGLSTTTHTPELTQISTSYYQQDEPRLLPNTNVSDMSASQTDPLKALATHITAIFDDDHHGQSASSLSLSNKPSRSQKSSQPVADVAPIVREEPSPAPADKWIILDKSQGRPYQCGYPGCDKSYLKKSHLMGHLIKHTGTSKFKCPHPECVGNEYFRDGSVLKKHMAAKKHTRYRPVQCDKCNRRFMRKENLEYHMAHVHSPKAKKNSPKLQSVPESSSATTTANTATTSTMTSWLSQPELAAGKRQQGSYVGISTTIDTPEPIQTPKADQQFSGLRLLADVSTSQINPFEALATHQTVILDDVAMTTRITRGPNLPGDQNPAERSPDPTDEWIIVDKSQEKPYRCGYPGCDKSYLKRYFLKVHFVRHTGKSKFKCPHPECAGGVYYRDRATLKRHMFIHTSEKPFQCDLCEERFGRKDHLKSHRKNVHRDKRREKISKTKEKITTN